MCTLDRQKCARSGTFVFYISKRFPQEICPWFMQIHYLWTTYVKYSFGNDAFFCKWVISRLLLCNLLQIRSEKLRKAASKELLQAYCHCHIIVILLCAASCFLSIFKITFHFLSVESQARWNDHRKWISDFFCGRVLNVALCKHPQHAETTEAQCTYSKCSG